VAQQHFLIDSELFSDGFESEMGASSLVYFIEGSQRAWNNRITSFVVVYVQGGEVSLKVSAKGLRISYEEEHF